MKMFFSIVLGLFLFACQQKNPQPVWLSLSEWHLNPSSQPVDDHGQLTHNFTDVCVYVDGKLIGFFELPCKIPIIAQGKASVTLYPVIRNNDNPATKKIYPFVIPHEELLDLEGGETYALNLQTRYANETHFWIEDFNSPNIQLITESAPVNASLVRSNNPQYALPGGDFYGHIHLTISDSLWIAYTDPTMNLPGNGKEVYLEIDYRNSATILTGLIEVTPDNQKKQHFNVPVNRQNTSDMKWKKIYIDLKDIVSNSASNAQFSHYFSTLLNTDESQNDVYIDNIKVVHF
jgi:hypothetical protein